MAITDKDTETLDRRRLRLADCLIKRMPPRDFIHEAALMLESPVILTATTYRVLAMDDFGFTVDDPVWEAARRTGYCSADDIRLFESEGVTRAVMESEEAFLLDQGLAARIPRVLKKIHVFGKVAAFIGVFQIDRRFTELDLRTTDLICEFLSLMMERDPKILGITRGLPESIIQDLISGAITSPTLLLDRLQAAVWSPAPPYRCVLITPAHRSQGIDNADYLIPKLMSEIRSSHVVHVEEGLLLLLPEANEKRVRRTEDVLNRVAPRYSLFAGISEPFDNLIYLAAYYRSSVLVRQVARQLKLEERVVLFDAVVFQALFSSFSGEQKMIFTQPEYKKLLAYDKDHNTDYCRTLRLYIETGCSVTETAEKLYVHRNTMTKRLSRIEEISGLDIHDGRRLIHFYLSSQL